MALISQSNEKSTKNRTTVRLSLEFSVQRQGDGYRAFLNVKNRLVRHEQWDFDCWDQTIAGALASVKKQFTHGDLQMGIDNAFQVPDPGVWL